MAKIKNNNKYKKVNIGKIIGKGYGRFWLDKEHRYICVKGSRGSKKSKTTALWIIYNMMKYPLSNTLVVRQVFNTLRDSCWTDLQWACEQLQVKHLWSFTKNPLEAIYKPTGQKILFRGLDNALSVTSIAVPVGSITYAWFEEAYQITNEEDFDKVDMSIRGKLPKGYFRRIMITFNPWSEHCWLKKRFFDKEETDERIMCLTTTYKCNEYLDESDILNFEKMKQDNPRRYAIEGEGEWGVAEGLIFDNFYVKNINESEIQGRHIYGLDFGYNDPTTLISAIVNEKEKKIYVYDEEYHEKMIPDEIENMIYNKGYKEKKIICDNARPELIAQFKKHGLRNIKSCTKGKDSILSGIQRLQNYKIYIDPSCVNLIAEMYTYAWDKDKQTGETLDKPIDKFNHCIDALRYAIQGLDGVELPTQIYYNVNFNR